MTIAIGPGTAPLGIIPNHRVLGGGCALALLIRRASVVTVRSISIAALFLLLVTLPLATGYNDSSLDTTDTGNSVPDDCRFRPESISPCDPHHRRNWFRLLNRPNQTFVSNQTFCVFLVLHFIHCCLYLHFFIHPLFFVSHICTQLYQKFGIALLYLEVQLLPYL